MTHSHEKTADRRFAASDFYAQEFWRERDRMTFAGLLAYGVIYTASIIVLGHVVARDIAVATAGVTYLSYAAQLARAPTRFSIAGFVASILVGVAAGIAFLAGV
jgi:hypothetical protein